MIDKTKISYQPLNQYLTEYKELNADNLYRPVAVGRYGIRTRESIYSKELAKDYSKNKLIYKGTLTVGMGSMQMDIGILSDDETYSVSPAYHTYRISSINYDYLRYCLQCRNKDMFIRYMKRGSRQGKSIDLRRWITYEIPVYPMQMQEEIVDRLDRVQKIIDSREKELQSLDVLIKARFVEMFGNILTDKNLPLVQLSELADIGSSKRIFANEYVEEGIPFYRSKEIRELGSGLKPSVELFIKPERYYEIKDKYGIPKIGDILIAAIGATIGYSWIVNTEKPFYYKDGNLIILSIKKDVNPIFLNHTMGILIEDFKNRGVAGSAQLALTIEKLENMLVVNPDINKQNQFAEFVQQVDKSKIVVQNSLNKIQMLFDSLMQQYFG